MLTTDLSAMGLKESSRTAQTAGVCSRRSKITTADRDGGRRWSTRRGRRAPGTIWGVWRSSRWPIGTPPAAVVDQGPLPILRGTVSAWERHQNCRHARYPEQSAVGDVPGVIEGQGSHRPLRRDPLAQPRQRRGDLRQRLWPQELHLLDAAASAALLGGPGTDHSTRAALVHSPIDIGWSPCAGRASSPRDQDRR